jgi:hypothetical protein
MDVYGKDKHPLDYFKGKSREDILKETGIGSKTYAKIRRALFLDSVKRLFGKKSILKIPIWIMIALAALAMLWFGMYFLIQFTNQPSSSVPVPSVASTTLTSTQMPVEVAAIDEVTEEVVVQEGVVYLRVETQRLDTAYGIWRREPGIPVFLSPFVEGDAVPNAQRQGTLRQVTEELLTVDSVLVAVTTFEAQPGMYWVWVDRLDLPAGCSVWVPRFVGDADSDIVVDEPVVVRLDAYEGFNTFVLKFQIVCGIKEVQSPTATSPLPSPTPSEVVPTSTPLPPTGTPTTPPPTSTEVVPTPTDPPPPTEVTCSACEDDPPATSVPTPVPMEATATPSR